MESSHLTALINILLKVSKTARDHRDLKVFFCGIEVKVIDGGNTRSLSLSNDTDRTEQP